MYLLSHFSCRQFLFPKKGIMSSTSAWVTYIWETRKSQDWSLLMTWAALWTKLHTQNAKVLLGCLEKARKFWGLLNTTFDQLYIPRQCCLYVTDGPNSWHNQWQWHAFPCTYVPCESNFSAAWWWEMKFTQRKAALETHRIPSPVEKVSLGRINCMITSSYYLVFSVCHWYRMSFFLSWETLHKQD